MNRIEITVEPNRASIKAHIARDVHEFEYRRNGKYDIEDNIGGLDNPELPENLLRQLNSDFFPETMQALLGLEEEV